MAIRSARQAQLAEQRKSFSGYSAFRGGSRSLTFQDRLSTLAKQTTQTELQEKIQLYNDGQISNEDMKKFLNGLQGSNVLSSREKLQVQNQVREFEDRIRVEKLTAVYKNTANNSPERVTAAQSLANFYNQKAASLQPDTPAYSTAIASAGQWSQTATAEKDQMARQGRSLKRAELFNEVANTAVTSVEEAQMKAQAYQQLAQQAYADGDQQAALQFDTQAQNAFNDIPRLQEQLEKQATTEQRRAIINAINELSNEYHDGNISASEFAQVIPMLDQKALEIGDTSIQLTLNRWSDTLAKDTAKGVKRGSFQGLPVVLGKGGASGSGSVSETDWDKQDFDYSDNLRLAKAMFDSGKIDGNKYAEFVGMAIVERNQQIEQRISTIYNLASENPNAKVFYEGRKQRVADVLEDLYQQEEGFSGQIQAFENGNFGLVMVSPSQFNNSGDPSAKGKWKPTFEIIDVRQLPKEQYIQDAQGVYHQIQKGQRYLTPEELAEYGSTGVYVDSQTGEQFFIKRDASGNPYIEQGQFVNVYDPDSGDFRKVDIQPGMTQVDDYAKLVANETMQAQDAPTAELKAPTQEPLNPNRLLPSSIQDFASGVKEGTKLIGQDVTNAAKPVMDKVGPIAEKAGPVAAKVVNPVASFLAPQIKPVLDVAQAASNIAQPAMQAIQPAIQSVQKLYQPTQLEREAGTRIAQPQNQAYNKPVSKFIPYTKPSQILNPQTVPEKFVSGALNVGAKVQKQLQKIPLIGGWFN